MPNRQNKFRGNYTNAVVGKLKDSTEEEFEKDEKHYYEIDFLLSRGNKICPIEVKSSGYKTHASLDAFRAKYSGRIKNSYLLYTKDFQIGKNELIYLPFYMTGMI